MASCDVDDWGRGVVFACVPYEVGFVLGHGGIIEVAGANSCL
jgi:hypothetical protein